MQKDGKEYLTKEKHEQLTKELNELRTKGRKEIAENLEYAKSLGDLSENAEFLEARTDQAEIEERIAKLETILKDAVILKARHSEVVDIGSTVVVQREGGDKTKYQIVGSEEADTKAGKISNRSPLGESMMGKKKGDKFAFKTPKGEVQYKVIDLE
ncbi:MAG: transcription elongation factor GreA [Patescibacteria group bacterium]